MQDASLRPAPSHASQNAVDALLSAAREQVQTQGAVSLELRLDRLRRLLTLLEQGRPQLAEAIEQDFGRKSPMETDTLEFLPLIMSLRHNLRELPTWMACGQRRAHWATWPAKAHIDYVPAGVIGIVSPWNYPLLLALGPAMGALAAGNRVVLKPSELVPHTNETLHNLISQHFDAEEMALVQGDVELSRHFCQAPWDHLVFTGSTRTGFEVMKAAAQKGVPVTLELGGRCPAWIDPKLPCKAAMVALLRGKLMNAGQTCVAPNHVYVAKHRLDSLIESAPRVAQQMYPQGLFDPHYTSLISSAHRDALQRDLDQAIEAGTRFVPLFESGTPVHNCMMPGLLIDPDPALAIAKREIFGPILICYSYDPHEDALPQALRDELSQRPHPLAAHVFSRRDAQIRAFRDAARAGMVVANAPLVHVAQDQLPFGGLGASGIGHYHGQEGFLRFSHQRSYYRQRGPNGLDWVFPPYRAAFKSKIMAALRRFG